MWSTAAARWSSSRPSAPGSREQIAAIPGRIPTPSCANYLFVRLDHSAAPLCAHLLERRILIRDCTGSPGVDGDAVRVAVRTRAENERLIAAWKEF